MIYYDAKGWGVQFIFGSAGSVFPRAVAWSLPTAVLAVVLNIYFGEDKMFAALATPGAASMWSGYTAVLGFLMVFRNNQAYNRFWEGAALTQQVRGEWLNAVSSLMAFSSQEEKMRGETTRFKHFVVRLMSMLHCAALQQIACVKDDHFEIINPEGICTESLKYLASHPPDTRCEIVLLWIQRLIVTAHADGTLVVAPPILTRAFQELSRGIVTLHDAQRIKEVPFPFPYSQLITTMLLVHTTATPVLASQVTGGPLWSGAVTFCIVSAFWALLYIALDIEQPFGEDSNKLPVAKMQKDMNSSLSLFLDDELRATPQFKYSQRCDLIRFEKSTTKIVRGFGSTETMEEGEDVEEVEENAYRRKALKPGFTFRNKSGSVLVTPGGTSSFHPGASPSFGKRDSGVCSMADVAGSLGIEALEAIKFEAGKSIEANPVKKKARFRSAAGLTVMLSRKPAPPSPKEPSPHSSPSIGSLPILLEHEAEPPDAVEQLTGIFPSHAHTPQPVQPPEPEGPEQNSSAYPFRPGDANTAESRDASCIILPIFPSPALPPGNPEEVLLPSYPGEVC